MTDRPLTELTVAGILAQLASGAPTPGGGAAASLAGALGAALVSMVCNLTVGRERYAASEAEAQAIKDEATGLLATLQDGVQHDADAYDALMATFRLPRASDEEKSSRTAAVQAATLHAATVPLEIAEACARVVEIAGQAVGKTNPNAASDLAVAALLAQAAIESAAENVEINLKSLTDERARDELSSRLAAARAGRAELAADVVRRTHA